MLSGGTDSRETYLTQPLHRLKLHFVNFMQIKNEKTNTSKKTAQKIPKPNIQWRIIIFEPMRSYRYIIPRKPLSGAINMRG